MELKFTNGNGDELNINIKGKCTITDYDTRTKTPNGNDLTVKVDGDSSSVMNGTEPQQDSQTVNMTAKKYSIFTALAAMDGDGSNLTEKDIALAKEQYKNGGEIWDSLQENGVKGIRYDSHAGVATILIDENDFLKIDFETRIEKIRKFFRIKDKTGTKTEKETDIPSVENDSNIQNNTVKDNKNTKYQPYDKFFTDLAEKESTTNPTKINESGFAGLYQIGEAIFANLGIYTEEGEKPYKKNDWKGTFTGKYGINSLDDFLNDKKIQKKVLVDAMKYNWDQIKKFKLDKDYLGRKINGQIITESGLLAAAHLGGVGSLKEYLRFNHDNQDDNHSSISEYLSLFAFYNMKEITGEDPVTKPHPKPPKIVEEEITYTVKSGDNLSKIAAKHKTTTKEIMNDNHLNSDKLSVGKKLTIYVPKDY